MKYCQKNYTSKTKLFADSLIVNAASLIEKSFFFIANIIIARYLSIEHFGEYSTALSFATFFSIMTDIGINVTLVRALNLDSKHQNQHFTNAFVVKLVLSALMYGIMAISLFFVGYSRDVIYLTLILGMVRIGNEFMKTYYAVDEARQKFLFPSLVNSIYVVFFLAGIATVILYKGNYYHICVVRLVIVYLFIAFLSVYTLRKFTFSFNTELFKKFVISAIPFSIITVLWNFAFRINVIILSIITGTTSVGIFSNSLIFIDTLSIIPGNLRRITMPVLYKALQKNDNNRFQFAFDSMSKYFSILSFYIMILLYIFARDIIQMIFGSKYNDSIAVLQILSFAVPFVFNIATIIIIGLDKQSVLSAILVIATAINIIANIILIRLFGVLGAAYSVVVTYGVIFVFGHWYLYTYHKLRLNRILIRYCLLMIISVLMYWVNSFPIIANMKFYFSGIIISALFVIFVFLVLINKDDVRLVKEMLKMSR